MNLYETVFFSERCDDRRIIFRARDNEEANDITQRVRCFIEPIDGSSQKLICENVDGHTFGDTPFTAEELDFIGQIAGTNVYGGTKR